MNGTNFSFVHTFGPLVQLFFALGLLILVAALLGGISFWGERKLLRTNKRLLTTSPIVASVICILYGVLRFSGLILYSTDGWDTTGSWNYTNQNRGIFIIFVFGCLLTGMILAIFKETRKHDVA